MQKAWKFQELVSENIINDSYSKRSFKKAIISVEPMANCSGCKTIKIFMLNILKDFNKECEMQVI